MAIGMGVTSRMVRGTFTRISSMATSGINKMISRAPRPKMDMSSLSLGKMLQNPRMHPMPAPQFPTFTAMRHMNTLGGYGTSPSTALKYQTGVPFFTFAKTAGLQENHLSSGGIGLALHKGRHTNLI